MINNNKNDDLSIFKNTVELKNDFFVFSSSFLNFTKFFQKFHEKILWIDDDIFWSGSNDELEIVLKDIPLSSSKDELIFLSYLKDYPLTLFYNFD